MMVFHHDITGKCSSLRMPWTENKSSVLYLGQEKGTLDSKEALSIHKNVEQKLGMEGPRSDHFSLT